MEFKKLYLFISLGLTLLAISTGLEKRSFRVSEGEKSTINFQSDSPKSCDDFGSEECKNDCDRLHNNEEWFCNINNTDIYCSCGLFLSTPQPDCRFLEDSMLNGRTLNLTSAFSEGNCFDICMVEDSCAGAEFNSATTPNMCRLYATVESVDKASLNGNKVFIKECLN